KYRQDADMRRRFLEEAQLMGQLQHPGIPPVHARGALADGRPYFAMKLIKGQTLAELLATRSQESGVRSQESGISDQPDGSLSTDHSSPSTLLGIFEQICQTMAYVHSHGIIHRDLKPANVMVGAFGEVQVMDWGLAKVLSSGGCQPPDNSNS